MDYIELGNNVAVLGAHSEPNIIILKTFVTMGNHPVGL